MEIIILKGWAGLAEQVEACVFLYFLNGPGHARQPAVVNNSDGLIDLILRLLSLAAIFKTNRFPMVYFDRGPCSSHSHRRLISVVVVDLATMYLIYIF